MPRSCASDRVTVVTTSLASSCVSNVRRKGVVMNPYEDTTLNVQSQQRTVTMPPARWPTFIGLIVGAGLMGYLAPIVALGLLSWIVYGWPAAMDNLERVARMHRQISVNSIAAFTPNIVLAILVAVAASKCIRSDRSQWQWWIIAGITFMSHVVVSFATARWNLIPWTWSSELTNATRSTLTLFLPFIVYVCTTFYKRRTTR